MRTVVPLLAITTASAAALSVAAGPAGTPADLPVAEPQLGQPLPTESGTVATFGGSKTDSASSPAIAAPHTTAGSTQRPQRTESARTTPTPPTAGSSITAKALPQGPAPSTRASQPVIVEGEELNVTERTVERTSAAGTTQTVEEVSGIVVHAYAEDPRTGAHTRTTWLETLNRNYEVTAGAITALPSGSWARMSRITERSADETAWQLERAVELTNTLNGTQDVLGADTGSNVHGVTVVLALPPGVAPDGLTPQRVSAVIDGEVAPFWAAQTRGKVTFQVSQTVNWRSTVNPCNGSESVKALWDEVQAGIGWTRGTNRHLLVYVPRAAATANCPVGLGEVRTITAGGRTLVTGMWRKDLVAHELGHNLGLMHSDRLVCSDRSDAIPDDIGVGRPCRVADYYDWSDVMGISHGDLGSLSSVHQETLGVGTQYRPLISTSTSFDLRPAAALDARRYALVRDPAGYEYYVEYRSATGQDAWFTARNIAPGVQIRRRDPAVRNRSLLIDTSPSGNQAEHDTTLKPGQSFTSTSNRVNIRYVGNNGASAHIVVTIDGVPATPLGQQPTPRGMTITAKEAATQQALNQLINRVTYRLQ